MRSVVTRAVDADGRKCHQNDYTVAPMALSITPTSSIPYLIAIIPNFWASSGNYSASVTR